VEVRQATQEADGRSWLAASFGLAALLGFAVILLRQPGGPRLGDYPEWTYHGVLLRDVLQGHADAGYALKTYPVPNSLTTVGLGLLMLVLPWALAAKVWLLLGAALGLYSGVQLQRAAGREQAWKTVLLPAAVVFGSAFWYGFMNFLLGTYLAMLFCALLFRRRESRWKYAALLTVLFFTHMIPFAFALLVFLLYVWERKQWSILRQALPALALCLWYFAGRFLHRNIDGSTPMRASVPWATPAFAAFKINTLLKSWGFINPSTNATDSILLRLAGEKGFLLLFVVNAALAVAVLSLICAMGWRSGRFRSPHRFFWMAVGLFSAVAMILPGAAAGISDPGGRMLQVSLWSAVCVISVQRKWLDAALTTCSALLLAVNCLLFAAVGMRQQPFAGAENGPLPARLREFAHVTYTNTWTCYENIESGRHDVDIYPTAMFVRNLSASVSHE
jgi:hypothetical protein